MKKTILVAALLLSKISEGQTSYTETFESFTLTSNSYYKDTNNVAFMASSAYFTHQWTMGTFPYWSGGFSYTNKYDSSTAGFSNLYGVIPYKGRNNSNTYLVGLDKAVIRPGINDPVTGFYFTNTTYAYKSMLKGDNFAKKFGGATGNDPDFFKVVINAYVNGQKKNDSVEFYLADFRDANNNNDYIVKDWRFVNTSVLGQADSLKFFFRSSDMGQFGVNTPMLVGLDDFRFGIMTGINDQSHNGISIFPNPFNEDLKIKGGMTGDERFLMMDSQGKTLREGYVKEGGLKTAELPAGIYFLKIVNGDYFWVTKIIKN